MNSSFFPILLIWLQNALIVPVIRNSLSNFQYYYQRWIVKHPGKRIVKFQRHTTIFFINRRRWISGHYRTEVLKLSNMSSLKDKLHFNSQGSPKNGNTTTKCISLDVNNLWRRRICELLEFLLPISWQEDEEIVLKIPNFTFIIHVD